MQGMNVFGWIFLVGAWSFILVLATWCFRKVLSNPDTTYEHPEKTQGPGSAPGA